MSRDRILAVHDISCVGRCSLTVALPIISSAGLECSVLPTAVLSTHTGGFSGFTYRDLTEDLLPIGEHWRSLGLKFRAIYTGFLGSFEQIDLVSKLFDELSEDGTTIYVDPVMADSGKLYSVFDDSFPKGMRKLCEKADVIMPNLTELALMLGFEWRAGPYTHEYIDSVLAEAECLGARRIVITGVGFEMGKVGAVFLDMDTGEKGEVMRDEIPGYYHGTGDVFGSALVGACESGLSLGDAVECAVDLTVGSIIRTRGSGEDVRFGVDFEPGLSEYAENVRNMDADPVLSAATNDSELRIIASLANSVWNEAYDGIVPKDQIGYMLGRFQSFEALREQVDFQGYTYLLLRCRGEPAGYCGYVPDDEGLFLSKIYILKKFRGRGLSDIMIGRLKDIAAAMGKERIHLTVNRDNERAISVYRHMGFEITGSADSPIGEGFVMNDYLMELRIRDVHPDHFRGGRPKGLVLSGHHTRVR